MFYLDTQRTITRRDSSLIVKRTSLLSVTDRETIPEVPVEQLRARGSVEREITSLFFESMLKSIVKSWDVLEVKEKKKKKNEGKPEGKPEGKSEGRRGKSKLPSSVSVSPEASAILDTVWWSSVDERSVIRFKNGNVYEGDISSKRMHGNGRFQWADGTVYIGQFKDNQISGRGTIEWKDSTWYTGEFDGNLRHGHGLFVDSRRQRSYSGSWYCGTKHGLGTITYSGDFQNTYTGDWNKNIMHGKGIREYCNQSAYCGEFECSTREGVGQLISSNHDFYKGQWKNGIIDGEGYYIWNCFHNNTMSAPRLISYEGTWVKALRHGYGLFHLGKGLVSHYKGRMKSNYKHGRGKLVTVNGHVISDKNLFDNDTYQPEHATYSIPAKYPIKRSLAKNNTLLGDNTRSFRYHIENALRNHKMNEHYARLSLVNFFIGNNNGQNGRSSEVNKISELLNDDFIDFEDQALRKVVIRYERNITNIYNIYSKICNTEPVYFSAVLIRLYFWQFCYDCNFHEKGINLTQIDNLLSSNKHLIMDDAHNPFERIYRWQFVHALIMFACHFYVGNSFPGPKPDTMVASAFCYFMETDVLPNVGRRKGKLVKNTFVPLPALYALYLSLDEPRTVRKFLCATRISPHLYMEHPQPPMINAEEEHIPCGQNCFLFGDEMIFVEERRPVLNERPHYDIPDNLQFFNLGNLSSKCIIQHFSNILPKLVENGKIMNIETEITFYEFFEAFIACTEESIRVKEEELKWKAYYPRKVTAVMPLQEINN